MIVRIEGQQMKQKKVHFKITASPVSTLPVKKEKPPKPTKCCSGNGCMGGMGSTSPEHHHRSTRKLQNKITDNERRTPPQRVHKAMCTTQLERVEDYLRVSPILTSNLDLAVIIDQAKINGWYIEPHEIELCEQIGQGSTANIYRGSWKGLDVAVKCIYPNFFNSNLNGVAFFVQEIESLSRQRHPFVLRLMGACLDPPDHGWVVTEFLGTTLQAWLHGHEERRDERSVPLPPLEDRVAKALEIAQAMQYLHEQRPKLIHRDLKPSNIFMDDAMHVRVADFGHARFLSDGEKAHSGEIGTFVYMAPEVIRCEPYNEKCDVYSYGVILNELITGEHPFIETTYGPTEIALEVGEGKLRPKLPEDDGQLTDLIDLIRQSWDENTSIRPPFATITCTLRKILEGLITAV